MERIDLDEGYVLNQCAKYLARDPQPARHAMGRFPSSDSRARFAEGWRFPVIDEEAARADEQPSAFNRVTFVYREDVPFSASEVAVVGDCGRLWAPEPLARVPGSIYFAGMFRVAVGRVYRYHFLVDGSTVLDGVNPQRQVDWRGNIWSRFFTRGCSQPVAFQDWQRRLLDRLVDHILPLNTSAGKRFLQSENAPNLYRLDQSIGIVNYIDKLLVREESHHLIDYTICLELIDAILRQRSPFIEPHLADKSMFVELYDQMAGPDAPPGWDVSRYGSPGYFLQLLRRHTVTGAFSHPRYGGNREAAGWAFLAELFRDANGATLFDWRRAIEPPLGTSANYRG